MDFLQRISGAPTCGGTPQSSCYQQEFWDLWRDPLQIRDSVARWERTSGCHPRLFAAASRLRTGNCFALFYLISVDDRCFDESSGLLLLAMPCSAEADFRRGEPGWQMGCCSVSFPVAYAHRQGLWRPRNVWNCRGFSNRSHHNEPRTRGVFSCLESDDNRLNRNLSHDTIPAVLVAIAQLVRAPDCGSGSRRFEPG